MLEGSRILFISQSCHKCPQATKKLSERQIEHTIADCSTDEGLGLAKRYNVTQVPTLLHLDSNKNEIKREYYG